MVIRIKNVGREVTEKDIRAKFDGFGKVLSVIVMRSKVFLKMEGRKQAHEAAEMMNGESVNGKVWKVDVPRDRTKTVCHTHLGFLRLL